MPSGVFGEYASPLRASLDSARSSVSLAVQVGEKSRRYMSGRVNGLRRVGARQFLSPCAARPLQRRHPRQATCACSCY